MSRSIFALRRLNHSFVVFCEGPCSRGVIHRRECHCAEKPKSMSKHVSFFDASSLPVLVECRPSSPDSISDFGRLLLLERNRLTQVSQAFSSCHCISTLMSSISISFLMFELWLRRIFAFPGWIPSPTFSVLRLNSHNIFGAVLLSVQKSTSRQQISCL